MTALAKLWRTTAFRITLLNLLAFLIFSFASFGYLAWNARRVIEAEIGSTIDAEIKGLAEQYGQGGMRRLVMLIERRSQQPGASVYLLTNAAGQRLAGNILSLPSSVLQNAGVYETRYQPQEDSERTDGQAVVKSFIIPNGFRIVVGRDVEDRNKLRDAIQRTFRWSIGLMVLVGGIAGLIIARRVLRRVDAMTETTQRIMAGSLSDRLAVSGAGDELDRLATNLNAMLDRIGELMTGLQQVSDNIAHDLKTPLTRLRNRAEDALRRDENPEQMRKALEGAIDDSDNLIRVFNALLTIARLESGNTQAAMTAFDVTAMLRDLAELYEPSAEEALIEMQVDVPQTLMMHGNRELVGQAFANLIDNAIKYAAPEVQGKMPENAKTNAQGKAKVTIAARPDGSGVVCTISDSGPGIPQVDRERVLKRFERLESARTRPGFGLGLSLVAAVAKLHAAQLTLGDNAPGLRVSLAFPAPNLDQKSA
ncbi:MAG: ATP-binding protein [Beijerinckiaceae bacterium]